MATEETVSSQLLWRFISLQKTCKEAASPREWNETAVSISLGRQESRVPSRRTCPWPSPGLLPHPPRILRIKERETSFTSRSESQAQQGVLRVRLKGYSEDTPWMTHTKKITKNKKRLIKTQTIFHEKLKPKIKKKPSEIPMCHKVHFLLSMGRMGE